VTAKSSKNGDATTLTRMNFSGYVDYTGCEYS